MKNRQFHFELLTRSVNFYFFTFELLSRSWKTKNFTFEILLWKMKKQNYDFEVARDFIIELKYTIQNYLKKCKHVRFCDFRYRSCSQQVLFTTMRTLSTLCYCVFWKKLLLLACVVNSKDAVFKWILGFQWLMQVHWHKYSQD